MALWTSKTWTPFEHFKARRCRGASVTIFESDTSSQAGVQIAHYTVVSPREDIAAQPSDYGIHVTEPKR
jgi:hypothetical protein